MNFANLTGRKFGRLTALDRVGSRKGGGAIWRLRCDCGNVVECDGANVRKGRTKSCGCLKAEGPVRHGLSKTRTHNVWGGMRQRCNNPNSPHFHHYGGRGIKVCERWESFDNFLADMGEAPTGMSIERKDNNGDYTPENCIWASRDAQIKNRRTSLLYEYEGETLTIKEWGERIGVPYKTMQHRYSIGKRGRELLAPLRGA